MVHVTSCSHVSSCFNICRCGNEVRPDNGSLRVVCTRGTRVCFSSPIWPTGLRTVHKVPSIWLWGQFELADDCQRVPGFWLKIVVHNNNLPDLPCIEYVNSILESLKDLLMILYRPFLDILRPSEDLRKTGLKSQRSKRGSFGFAWNLCSLCMIAFWTRFLGSTMKLLGSLHSSWGYKNERSWESNKMRLLQLPTIWYSYFLCGSADFLHQTVCDHNVNGYTTYVPYVEHIL